eukprot:m.138295 g.138295  ORF g.138295 m.138295 type:complete len:586 (+) comp15914_c0_seq2:188-1945(+)
MSVNVSAGSHFHVQRDVLSLWQQQKEQGFDFIAVPLASGDDHLLDTSVSSTDWSQHVVGFVSHYDVDADPSKEKDLVTELHWATHLGVAAIVIPLRSLDCCNLASITNPFVHSADQIATWIHVKTTLDSTTPEESSWHWWNRFRIFCTPCTRLGLALEISSDICDEDDQKRWLGEPIKCVILSTEAFLTNAKGYPVLSRAHQRFIRALFKLKPQFILTGLTPDSTGYQLYLRYLKHLVGTMPRPTIYDRATEGYDDYIEIPLQPLMDHLESQTYEVFEKDPVKYEMYELAMEAAFADRRDKEQLVAMVVGAGRGPLVRCALRAAEKAGVTNLKLFALEKNPGAVRILRHYQATEWGDKVQVFAGDMRTWATTEKADVLISELLGSWGDNELSPECLDGAQRFLASDGVSIPYRYRSFVAPISTHKNYTELKTHKERKHLETPYVILLSNFTQLGEIQPVFEFTHPNFPPPNADADWNPDNTRFCTIKSTATQDGLMHGFVGYFDSHLYNEIMISIHPDTHTAEMFSWFPMYIPLQTPIPVKKGDVIEAAFWRKVSSSKVWYEWAIISPMATEIHNLAGRSSFLGL